MINLNSYSKMKNGTRFFLVLLTAWLLLGSIGFAWNRATCVYTGSKNYSIGTAQKCCVMDQRNQSSIGRSSCCEFDQFQVKFALDQSIKKVSILWHQAIFVPFISPVCTVLFPRVLRKPTYSLAFFPPPLRDRLALIQVYQI